MIKFTVFGFEISITFGFLLIISLLALSDSTALGIAAASSCLIHELGHCFMAVILNVKFKSLKLWAGGIQIEREHQIISLKSEILILICGPAINIVAALFYMYKGMYDACSINIITALFNMLPYSSLDGGSILKSVLEFNDKNTSFQKYISLLFGITIILFFLLTKNINISAFVTLILLMVNECIA